MYRGIIFGTVVMVLIALAATFLSKWVLGVGNITIALLIAIIVGFSFSFPVQNQTVFRFAEKNILAWATILLGFGLNLTSILSLSPFYTAIVVLSVLATLLFGQIFRKYTGERLAWLLGAGNGICGNSAIGATAPLLQANVTEIGLAVATINILGMLGIFFFPPLAFLLGLNSQESAVFIGAILQSIGHVVAAGYSIDPAIGAMALLVKMGRILLLGPVILLIGMSMKHSGPKPTLGKIIPYYVWGFLLASLLTSSQLFPKDFTALLEKIGSYLLLFAMIGIGLGINMRQLVKLGPSTLIVGSGIFLLQIIFVLGLVFISRLL